MAQYTLDELAARIMAREKKRKETGFPFAMDGTGLEGNCIITRQSVMTDPRFAMEFHGLLLSKTMTKTIFT